jgi:thiamine-monophosphate kinase
MSEFDLIKKYFTRATPSAALGIGDDAALLKISAGNQLAISTDMLVSGTHFFADADPYFLGHKSLAVNLSDLAAMGATPRWATLALSLPEANEAWLASFSAGFFSLAEQHGVELIGGDTTRGSLNICVTIMGEVAAGKALRRDGAKVGDDIWLSGQVGAAALGLASLQGKISLPETVREICLERLHRPQPRVKLGLSLRDIAHSTIDISDGLLADLSHILECSKVAAVLQLSLIPLPEFFAQLTEQRLVQQCLLAGGDDYELCFTAAAEQRTSIVKIAENLGLPLMRIGKIVAGEGLRLIGTDGSAMKIERLGYDHF